MATGTANLVDPRHDETVESDEPDVGGHGASLDRRSPERRALAQTDPVGDIEGMAQRIVHAITGVPVEIQDDGRGHAIVDLRIHYPDREAGFVEVVTDMNGAYAAMWRRVMSRDATLTVPDLDRVWRLTVSAKCNVNRLSVEAATLLAQLTATDETFDHHLDLVAAPRHPNPNVERLVELGVVGVFSRATKPGEPGQIRLDPEGITGPIDIDWHPILHWVNTLLASSALSDVRAKLAATGATERHVFLGITQSSPGEAFFALSHRQSTLPLQRPHLPAEITHLWMANVDMIGRCLAWFPDLGWLDTRRPRQAD